MFQSRSASCPTISVPGTVSSSFVSNSSRSRTFSERDALPTMFSMFEGGDHRKDASDVFRACASAGFLSAAAHERGKSSACAES